MRPALYRWEVLAASIAAHILWAGSEAPDDDDRQRMSVSLRDQGCQTVTDD